MNREIGISAVVVMAILLAGGVYSQLTDSGSSSGIEKGMDYLASQPNLDSELLIFHLLKNNTNMPESMIAGVAEGVLQKKIGDLDDYHYPLKQFLLGNSIVESEIDSETLESAYYRNFVDYFSCKPLSQDWIEEMGAVTEGDEFQSYDSAHSLLILQLIQNDYFGGRCGDQPEFGESLKSKISEKIDLVKSQLSDKDNFDAWVERVAVLGFVGESILQEDVDYILSKQLSSGGWKPVDYYSDDEGNPHTTALAVWALLEASS